MNTSTERPSAGFSIAGYLLVGLSLSIGWGIRGNFGHEYGAMIPGALAAIAVAIASGRDDWMRRVPYFGFLGAVGWSFGGSQSYMQVIGYTHSGHTESIIYGYACLTLMGFLWACFGGAFTAFPAFLDRKKLTGLVVPALVVLGAWLIQDYLVGLRQPPKGGSRHEDPLYWFDTDWMGASTALVSIILYMVIRRKIEFGSSLILHMAAGWLAGFLILVVGIGFRMTPPRGDNWSGCLGMFVGLMIFLIRHRETGVAWVTMMTGAGGGIGFALGQAIKLMGISTGVIANWHSVLEQSYGFLNGLAVAIPMSIVAARQPAPSEEGYPEARWTSVFGVWFTICVVTYVNLIKNVSEWIKLGAMPTTLTGIPTWIWYTGFYVLLSVVVLILGLRHQKRTLAFVPTLSLGRAQLIFMILLWWMVVGNFERAMIKFTAPRLVTEGVITLNALICTLLASFIDRPMRIPVATERPSLRSGLLIGTLVSIVLLAGLNIYADWQITRAFYGEKPVGHATLHIRFGPNATTKPGPVKGAAHP